MTPKGKALDKSRHEITEQRLKHHWSTGKPYNYKGVNHRVGKMSYGDYFMEAGKDRGEKGGFNRTTKWMRRTDKSKNVDDKGSRLTERNTKGGNYHRTYSPIYKPEK